MEEPYGPKATRFWGATLRSWCNTLGGIIEETMCNTLRGIIEKTMCKKGLHPMALRP